MAGFAFAWSWQLARRDPEGRARDWVRAFALLGLASLLGGAYHGFQAMLSAPAPDVLWRATLAVSALASLFLLRGGISQFSRRYARAGFRFANLKFMGALLAGIVWPEFLVVLIDFALTLLIVTGYVISGRPLRDLTARLFLSGVALFVLGAAVQALRLAPHPLFNHNDLFHVIQILGNWLFYRCARRGLEQSS